MAEKTARPALIFDYDGTIHDTMRIYRPAVRRAFQWLREQGHTVPETSDRQIASWLGMNTRDMWNSFLPEDQETIAAIVRETCEKAAQMAEESNNDYMSKLQEEGIEVVTFTDDELNAFAESCRANVWPQLEENYPEGFLEGIEESLQ